MLDASLDWWYTSTLYNAVSTFSIQFDTDDSPTGWTLLPASTPFNLSSALGGPTPVAAQTTIITQTAYRSPNVTTGEGQIPNVIVTPPPASLTIPSYSTTFSPESAFIHFDKYEVVSQTPQPYGNGPLVCATVTRTYTLETPVAFPYNGPSGNLSGVLSTGDVNPAFLGSLGKSFAVAGSWKATPTVAIVVQDVFAAEAVLAASIEASEKSLLTPSATLPSFLSPVHQKTTDNQIPNGNPKGHTETTQKFLLVPTLTPTTTAGGDDGNDNGNGSRATSTTEPEDGGGVNMVPFVAHLEHSETTLQVPTPGDTNVITTKVKGVVVTATRSPGGGQPGKANGGGGRGKDTVAVNAVHGKPSNAFEVLSEALASAKDNTPSATGTQHGDHRPNDSRGGVAKTVPIIMVGQSTLTGDSRTNFQLPGSKTLTPGGTARIDGTSLSLVEGGSSIVINGHTKPVSNAVITQAPALTIGSHVYHATGGSTYIIQGQTLIPGGVISVGGTFVSLAPGLSTIVINGKTRNIGGTNNPTPAMTSPPLLTIAGRTYSAINRGATYVVDGKTLTPSDEQTVTVGGKTYIVSLAPRATVLKIETVGANGEVTATMFETLYPARSQATSTSTIGAGSASAASTHTKATPAQSSSSSPNLQNGGGELRLGSAAILFALGTFGFALWL